LILKEKAAMPNDNDNLTTSRMEDGLFARLKSFHACPSTDGQKLFSMIVPQGQQPVFIEATRMQVTANLQEANMAAWIMARRSGATPDPIVEEAAILRPRLDCGEPCVRYNPATRHVNWVWCFHHRLPLAVSFSLDGWLRLRTRTDAVCGIVGHLCVLFAIAI
jgi:hypothetical protein